MSSFTEYDKSDLERIFTYHPPTPEQTQDYMVIRERAKAFALLLCEFCPLSRERTLAIAQLESCVMWANASIARNAP